MSWTQHEVELRLPDLGLSEAQVATLKRQFEASVVDMLGGHFALTQQRIIIIIVVIGGVRGPGRPGPGPGPDPAGVDLVRLSAIELEQEIHRVSAEKVRLEAGLRTMQGRLKELKGTSIQEKA